MNVVVLIGRLVADPELKYTPNGVAVCSFRIAVDRKFKSESGERQADFIDIVAWRQSAEFVSNYMSKGRMIAVHGTLQQRSWVQQDGQKRSKIEVVADNLQALDSKPREGQQQSQAVPNIEYVPSDPRTQGSDEGMDYDPFAEE